MSVQLNITFEELIELVDQLKPEEQRALVERVQERNRPRHLTNEEFKALLNLMTIDLGTPAPDFSFRREDWYGDDGR